jgi:hypothetical protein
VTTTILQEVVASDVLAAVLGSLSVDKFSGDPSQIHTALARARSHYPILEVFNFSSGDVYPFSRELEDALSILQRSRMIRMQNPDFDTYLLTPNGRRVGREYLERFTEDDQRQVKELAEIFELECGIEDRTRRGDEQRYS